jgi:outer membrane protein TolC
MMPRRSALRVGALLLACSGAVPSGVSAQQADAPDSVLTLIEALARAIGSHPSLRVAEADYDAAGADLTRARADWLPQLSLRASLTQHQEPMIAYPLHELSAEVLPIFDRTLIQGGVDLGWKLFDGGGRTARIRSSRARTEQAAASRVAATTQLIIDVTRGYLGVLSTAEVLAALDEHLVALDAERTRVRQLLEQGQAAEVERLRVQAALAQADAERITTAATLDAAERSLARMLGLAPSAVRASRLAPVRLATPPLPARTTLVERLDSANATVIEARHAAESAEWARRAASATWWPRLEGFGGYGLWAIPDGNVQLEWQVGVRVSYPLFTGGDRSGAVAGATAQAVRARERLALVELTTRERLDYALTASREQRARAEAVAAAVRHLTEVTRIERLALETGTGPQTDFLRAEADLHRARAALVQAEYGELLAQLELANTTGDLSMDWLSRTLETTP